jgi:ABC-type polysaccharide/polyol phosphate transport system ATPase subunit
MYMRLGFAIATEVDPDILLIDEILAVGDYAFQQKCQARIDEYRRQGKTIVFVSHDELAVRRICQRALLIHDGQLMADGTTDHVLEQYSELLKHPVASAS